MLGRDSSISELVQIYFAEVYTSSAFAFLHPRTFLADLEGESLPLLLVQSVCCSAGTIKEPNLACLDALLEETKRNLYDAFYQPSTHALAATLNIINVEQNRRQNPSANWMLMGLAVRYAKLSLPTSCRLKSSQNRLCVATELRRWERQAVCN